MHLSFDLVTELRPGATARTILGRSLYVPAALLVLAIAGAGLTVPTLQAQGTARSLAVCFGTAWVVLGGILRGDATAVAEPLEGDGRNGRADAA